MKSLMGPWPHAACFLLFFAPWPTPASSGCPRVAPLRLRACDLPHVTQALCSAPPTTPQLCCGVCVGVYVWFPSCAQSPCGWESWGGARWLLAAWLPSWRLGCSTHTEFTCGCEQAAHSFPTISTAELSATSKKEFSYYSPTDVI